MWLAYRKPMILRWIFLVCLSLASSTTRASSEGRCTQAFDPFWRTFVTRDLSPFSANSVDFYDRIDFMDQSALGTDTLFADNLENENYLPTGTVGDLIVRTAISDDSPLEFKQRFQAEGFASLSRQELLDPKASLDLIQELSSPVRLFPGQVRTLGRGQTFKNQNGIWVESGPIDIALIEHRRSGTFSVQRDQLLNMGLEVRNNEDLLVEFLNRVERFASKQSKEHVEQILQSTYSDLQSTTSSALNTIQLNWFHHSTGPSADGRVHRDQFTKDDADNNLSPERTVIGTYALLNRGTERFRFNGTSLTVDVTKTGDLVALDGSIDHRDSSGPGPRVNLVLVFKDEGTPLKNTEIRFERGNFMYKDTVISR